MFKPLLWLLMPAILGVASLAYAADHSTIPADATLSNVYPAPCEQVVIIVKDYMTPDGGFYRAVSEPNKAPRYILYWAPGNDEKASEIYLLGKPIETTGDICAAFGDNT